MIGAFIYEHYGIETSLAIMGVMFIGSALVLGLLPKDMPDETASERKGIATEIKAGLHYVRSSAVLRNLGISFAFAGLGAGLVQPLGVFVMIENLGKDSSFLQWMMVVNGAAMMLGGTLVIGIGKK